MTANAKTKIFFEVCRLFFDLFLLVFLSFRFRSRFYVVWIGPKNHVTLSGSESENKNENSLRSLTLFGVDSILDFKSDFRSDFVFAFVRCKRALKTCSH